MCGRFIIQATWAEYRAYLTGFVPESALGRNDPARYNVAPTQDIPFIASVDGEYQVKDGRWWLVPWWAKEMPKFATFNARSETVHKSGAFRDAFKSKRCLIPASGYYEWTKNADDQGKDPWAIHLPDWEPFAFAGLWARNDNLDVTSCSIITAATPADIGISKLHNRVPIILKPNQYELWMNPDTDADLAKQALYQHRAAELTAYRVGRAVNKNTAKGAALIEPDAL